MVRSGRSLSNSLQVGMVALALGALALHACATSTPTPESPATGAEVPSDANAASAPHQHSAAQPPAAQASTAANPKRPGATVAETRTTQVIQSIVVQNRQSIRSCYESALTTQPQLTGKLTIHFTIDPAGNISRAEVNAARSTLRNANVEACAIAALRRIAFPRSSRGFESNVNYPFDFKP